jgi:hypothetical protein
MFSNKLATFAAVAATLAALQGVVAAPVSSFNSLRVRDDAKASAGGHFVVYQDSWVSGEQGPPDVKDIAGFDAFIMSFWLSSAPADQAVVWFVGYDLTAKSSFSLTPSSQGAAH